MRALDRVGLVESGCVLDLGSRLLSNAIVAAAEFGGAIVLPDANRCCKVY